jgi:hypothetical protein
VSAFCADTVRGVEDAFVTDCRASTHRRGDARFVTERALLATSIRTETGTRGAFDARETSATSTNRRRHLAGARTIT